MNILAETPPEPTQTADYEYVRASGNARFEVHAYNDEAGTTVRARTTHADSAEAYDVLRVLHETSGGWDYRGPEAELVGLVAPDEHLSHFNRASRFVPVYQALGYQIMEDTVTANGQTTHNLEYRYPSLPYLNAAAAEILPSTPLKMVPFVGGQYDYETFIRSLADKGEVLVATEQPYQLHDHGVRHLLGWLAMGEDFVNPLRERLSELLDEHDSNPGSNTNNRLSQAMFGVDLGSYAVAYELMEANRWPARPTDSLTNALSASLWADLYRDPTLGSMPIAYLDLVHTSFFADCAQTMWNRYATAEAAATR